MLDRAYWCCLPGGDLSLFSNKFVIDLENMGTQRSRLITTRVVLAIRLTKLKRCRRRLKVIWIAWALWSRPRKIILHPSAQVSRLAYWASRWARIGRSSLPQTSRMLLRQFYFTAAGAWISAR